MTLGEVVAFNVYLLLLASPTQQLGFAIGALGEATAGGQRPDEILDIPEEIQAGPGAPELPSLRGCATFADVSFFYRGERRALHDIAFEAYPNQVIALIGPTGSSKTSLINLLPRFYDPTAGRVLLDGHDIRRVELQSLRRQRIAIADRQPLTAVQPWAALWPYSRIPDSFHNTAHSVCGGWHETTPTRFDLCTAWRGPGRAAGFLPARGGSTGSQPAPHYLRLRAAV